MKKSNTTIKHIAEIAGVTPTTVSMALNNRPRISQLTRKKILRIAEELNYEPNIIARSLRKNKSYTIGLLIKNIADPFYPELAKGIIETGRKLGYNIILCNVNDEMALKVKHLKDLRQKRVDGIISTTVMDGDPYLESLLKDSYPFVAAVRRAKDSKFDNYIDSVTLDNFLGGYQAIEHLYKLGHDRIGIIAGNFKSSTAADRTKGCKKALLDRGIKISGELISECDYSHHKAMKATTKFLNLANRPTAIFAQDDNMALGVREVILRAGLKIPEDIALVGFDNIKFSSVTGIDLTTIDQKIFEMGKLSVELLVSKIEENNPPLVKKIVLQPELLIRKSCGYYIRGYLPDRN